MPANESGEPVGLMRTHSLPASLQSRGHPSGPAVLARFLRISPLAWTSSGCPPLRVEVFGESSGFPLGLQSDAVADDQIKASSETAGGPAKCARLGGAGAWRPDPARASGASLTVRLKARAVLTGFAVQGGEAGGAGCSAGWPVSYRLEVSTGSNDWRPLGSFAHGREDASSVATHLLPRIAARVVRLVVTAWGGAAPALRLELLGSGLEEPLGIAAGVVSDSQLQASSEQPHGAAQLARLLGRQGAWISAAADTRQWLQVDLRQRRAVVGLALQGRPLRLRPGEPPPLPMCVSSFALAVSDDARCWRVLRRGGSELILPGNHLEPSSSRGDAVVTHYLPAPVLARFVRVCPRTWEGTFPALRLEVYGSSRGAAMEDDEVFRVVLSLMLLFLVFLSHPFSLSLVMCVAPLCFDS